MNRKKEFLTWVLMRYGTGGVIPSELRAEYTLGLERKEPHDYFKHPLAWGDYEENERYGLHNFLTLLMSQLGEQRQPMNLQHLTLGHWSISMNLNQADIDFLTAQLMMNGMGKGKMHNGTYNKVSTWLYEYEIEGYLLYNSTDDVQLTDKAITAIKEWNDVHG